MELVLDTSTNQTVGSCTWTRLFGALIAVCAKRCMKKRKTRVSSSELPAEFFDRLQRLWGNTVCEQIKKTFIDRPTTFRINTIKGKREVVLEELKSHGFSVQRIPWYADAFVLKNKDKRTLMELDVYTSGKLYLQSLASMVPTLVLDPEPGEKILDMTAAPGSKTSQIAALMQKHGELIANDNNKVRFFKLKHNMELLGVSDPAPNWEFRLRMEHGIGIAKEYLNYFDKILLDAPCSAEARFIVGQPKTYGYWKERKIKEMAFKQRGLLFAAWSALKPCGTLVYSTCTFAPEENEVQIDRLLRRFPDEVEVLSIDLPFKRLPILKERKEVPLHKNVQQCLRIFPTSEIEGFFIAKLKKQI